MIIGITAPMETGKSTAANYLKNKHGYEIRSFASGMREALKILGIFPKDKKTNPKAWRKLMQQFGQITREYDPDIHVNLMSFDGENIVIDDVRFDNEAELIRDNGGLIIRLIPNENWIKKLFRAIKPKHITERGVNDKYVIFDIQLTESVYDLYDFLDVIAKK